MMNIESRLNGVLVWMGNHKLLVFACIAAALMIRPMLSKTAGLLAVFGLGLAGMFSPPIGFIGWLLGINTYFGGILGWGNSSSGQ